MPEKDLLDHKLPDRGVRKGKFSLCHAACSFLLQRTIYTTLGTLTYRAFLNMYSSF